MEALTADEIRSGFVNCTKGEATRFAIPNLDAVPWADLDFFGWRDPGSLVAGAIAVRRAGEPLTIMLRATQRPASARQGMCSLCHTFHPNADVAFMGARRAGTRGREGNSVATSMCADLACSLYARKLKQSKRVQPQETLDVDARVQRLELNLLRFVARVVDGI